MDDPVALDPVTFFCAVSLVGDTVTGCSFLLYIRFKSMTSYTTARHPVTATWEANFFYL